MPLAFLCTGITLLGVMVFSTSEFCVSQRDSSSTASFAAAASSALLAASSLSFSARWNAGGSQPPSSPPDSLVNWTIKQSVKSQ